MIFFGTGAWGLTPTLSEFEILHDATALNCGTSSYRTQKKIAWKSIFFQKKILSDSFETLYTYVIADEEFFKGGPRP